RRARARRRAPAGGSVPARPSPVARTRPPAAAWRASYSDPLGVCKRLAREPSAAARSATAELVESRNGFEDLSPQLLAVRSRFAQIELELVTGVLIRQIRRFVSGLRVSTDQPGEEPHRICESKERSVHRTISRVAFLCRAA